MKEEEESSFTISSDNYQLIVELNNAFEEAEKLLKKIENNNKAFCASITNELRYAGRHFLNAVVSEKTQDDELRKAIKHCHRATYDGSDALVIFHLEYIAAFENDYKNISLLESIPEWKSYLLKAEDAKDFIEDGINRSEERHENARRCLEHSDILNEITKEMRVLRPELNKRIADKTNDHIRWAVGIVIGVLAIVVTIAVS